MSWKCIPYQGKSGWTTFDWRNNTNVSRAHTHTYTMCSVCKSLSNVLSKLTLYLSFTCIYVILKPGKSLSFSSLSFAGFVVIFSFFARAHARVCVCVCISMFFPPHFIHSCCTVVLLDVQWNSTMCCKHVKWSQVRVKDRCRRINRLVQCTQYTVLHIHCSVYWNERQSREEKMPRIATKRIALVMLMMMTTMMIVIINRVARSSTSAGRSN